MNRPGCRTSLLCGAGPPILPRPWRTCPNPTRSDGAHNDTPKEIDMKPTPGNMIAFALAYLLFVAGLIAIGYLILT
jgi:hypothetical protein